MWQYGRCFVVGIRRSLLLDESCHTPFLWLTQRLRVRFTKGSSFHQESKKYIKRLQRPMIITNVPYFYWTYHYLQYSLTVQCNVWYQNHACRKGSFKYKTWIVCNAFRKFADNKLADIQCLFPKMTIDSLKMSTLGFEHKYVSPLISKAC